MLRSQLLTIYVAIFAGLLQLVSAAPITLVRRTCPPGTQPAPPPNCTPGSTDPLCATPPPPPSGQNDPKLSLPDLSCVAIPTAPALPAVPGLPVPAAPTFLPIQAPVPAAPVLPTLPTLPGLPDLSGVAAPGLPDLSGVTAPALPPMTLPTIPTLALPALGGGD